MRLIVTEKDSAAHKIADILGGKVDRQRARPRPSEGQVVLTSTYDGDEAVAIGLRGHVMETMFPNTYRRWSLKYLGDMIREPDLAWIVDGGAAGTMAALRTVAKGATEIIIATDFDREGELIGQEALEILRGDALQAPPGRQAREGQAQGRRPRRAKRSRRAPAALGGRRRPAHSRRCCRRPP